MANIGLFTTTRLYIYLKEHREIKSLLINQEGKY